MYKFTGGRGDQGFAISSTEYWNGAEFQAGPDMPEYLQEQCAVAINSTHFIMAGGHDL